MLTNPERLKGTERAIIVGLRLPSEPDNAVDDHLDELEKLIEAAGGQALARLVQDRHAPDPATYIGKGKAEEVAKLAGTLEASLVVFDDDLTPGQIRNLEKTISVKVVDRSTLILDIFAGRARTREAKTQVELAQLQYLLPRLTRQWSHLSRQAGGIGTRGVGETQLEIDRRLVRNRIGRLRDDLEKIERTRRTQREGRWGPYSVALVGYTNAGKSTLFNRLTGDETFAANKLFATLDSRIRKAGFETPRDTVVIDTVGFVRKLPHHLVASFRSTMEEAVSADLVLHIVDFSHPQHDEQESIGEEVLDDLGIREDRVLTVYNKIDRIDHEARTDDTGTRVWLSALEGEGI
ncbi:MAG: GTPase HflX, partial [Thermoanaerobaculia bacterium]|nr:GTPase HflX [Thermoanaerobaculia bacterium]